MAINGTNKKKTLKRSMNSMTFRNSD